MPVGNQRKTQFILRGHTMYGLRGITWMNDERTSEEESIALKFDYDGMLTQKKVTELLTGAIQGSDIDWLQSNGNNWCFDLGRMKEYFKGPFPNWPWLSGLVFVEPELEHIEKQDIGKLDRSRFRTKIEFMITQQSPRHPGRQTEDPIELTESLTRFRVNHPDPSRTAFLIMRFADSKPHDAITTAVRKTLGKLGITVVRADDKEYHPDLFGNVRTYLHGCGFGIAVFERIETEYFNPNVSLEVGYLMAMGKPVCLLKDKSLAQLQADLVGRLYRNFDVHNVANTIDGELTAWLADKDLIPPSSEST